jgi:hypothetical protein
MHNFGRPNILVRLEALFFFALTITASPMIAVASALTISGSPPTTGIVGEAWRFQPTASGGSGKALQFSITNKPSWLSFYPATGLLSATPAAANVGEYRYIRISVTDGTTTLSLPAFQITIAAAAASTPPTISGTPAKSVVAGQAYAFTPAAKGAAGSTLSFSIVGKPSWAVFSIATGELSGTPTAAQTGTYANIVISVSNGTTKASLAAFSIVVSAATAAPVAAPTITGTPATTVVVGHAYAFTPKASVAAGKTASFSISGKPSWASFSATTGALSGTPAAANVGTTSNIIISVSDGTTKASLAAFSIVVSAAAAVPTITGTPVKSVVAGQAYAFTPKATVAAGKTASFSISGKPGWASFSATTGELSGTPTAANVGTTSNIIISVSDGTTSASLPAFAVAVTQVGTYSVTLSWSAPTQNSNGTALTNLAGYRIYYGTSASAMTQTVTISSVGVTTHVLSNLNAQTYYFGVMAYNAAGVESKLSNVVSKTL